MHNKISETMCFVVSDDNAGIRLDIWLHNAYGDMSRSRIKSLIDSHMVFVNGISVSASYKVKSGDSLHLSIPVAEEAKPIPVPMEIDVVYEDDDLLLINKPVGLVVHPACGHSNDTLVNGLLAYCGDSLSGIGGVKRPGIVHRLDKGTSGLMVVAKNDMSHKYLSAQFSNRTLSRSYKALVWGIPHASGFIETMICRSSHDRQKMAVVERGGKIAITKYKLLSSCDGISLVQCALETGRTHQIRVHMSHMGHSLLGDPVYGREKKGQSSIIRKASDEFKRLERPLLHADKIHFIHPRSEKPMEFEIKIHEDFLNFQCVKQYLLKV
jgi:23S rRNA pseudouridine1911/1915/1917 synthase